MSRVSAHIRHNIWGILALYVALGGVAFAASTAPKNSVLSRSIKNGQVKNADLASNAVNSAKVANGSLSGADLAANSVTGQQVDESSLDPSVVQKRVSGTCTAGQVVAAVNQDGSVACAGSGGPPSGAAGGDLTGTYPNPTIGAGTVNSAKIADGTIAAGDLAAGSVSGGAGGTVADNSLTGADVLESSLDSSLLQFRISGAPCTAGQAITNVAATGAATCGTTSGGAPGGAAGGDLAGTYPNPTIGAGKVTSAKLATAAVGPPQIGTLPAVAAVSTGSFNCPAVTECGLQLNGEDFDTSNMHSTSSNTNVLIAPIAGFYHYDAAVDMQAPNSSQTCRISVSITSTAEFITGTTMPCGGGLYYDPIVTTSGLVHLAAGDSISVAGITSHATVIGREGRFDMNWVGP